MVREIGVKVIVTLVAGTILWLVPTVRDGAWNLSATPVYIPIAWLLLFALALAAAGSCGTYFFLRSSLQLGRIDSMTKTLRADGINAFLEKRIAEATSKNQKFAVLLVDIDNFKSINDKHDHEIGNHTLAEVADTIRPRSPGEEIFRYGGDEFLIITKLGIEDRECWGYAKRIIREVADCDFLGAVNSSKHIKLTVSCGCVLAGTGSTVATLRKDLVEALKKAKQPTKENPKGKNAAYLHSGELYTQPPKS